MSVTADALGKLIVLRDGQGAYKSVGRMVAFADGPTVTVRHRDGTQTHWMASLCSWIETDLPDEAVEELLPLTPYAPPTDKERADCNLACLLHLVSMVERGDFEEARKYCEYTRAMLRLIEKMEAQRA